MKKNSLIVLLATFAFSFLFYKQSQGLNHGIFSVIIPLLFLILKPELRKETNWILAAIACLYSGTVAAITGSPVTILLNMFCILVVSYISVSPKLSVITGSVYAGLSSLSGLFIAGVNTLTNYLTLTPVVEEKTKTRFRWYYLALPLFILIIFLELYRQSSGAFMNLTNKIDLSFISPGWIIFTFIGFLFLYGIFIKPK